MITSTKDAPELINDVLRAGLVPMLHGSPGTAKSSMARQYAEEHNLKLFDVRLSTTDPTVLDGLFFLKPGGEKAGSIPLDVFPIVGDELPVNEEGIPYDGWLVLLDEFNSAPRAVQAAAYKLVLDRKVGQHDLHPRVVMIAAGNLTTDRAIVNNISTAMQSRLIHAQIELNPADWIDWANSNGIDYRVVAYVGFKPDILNKFDPNHDDFTFPCGRTLEFLSKIIKPWKTIQRKKTAVISGAIGEGAAREFIGFCSVFDKLPTIDQILNQPEKIEISDEPSIKYAISNLISHHVTTNNFDTLMICITNLPIEFQVICLQASFRRCPEIGDNDTWKKWTIKNAQELM